MHQSEPGGLTRWLRRLVAPASASALALTALATPTVAQAETRQSESIRNAASSGPIYQLINQQTNQCLNSVAETEPCSNSAGQRWWWDSSLKLWVHEESGGCLTKTRLSKGFWIQLAPCRHPDTGERYPPIINHVELGGGLAMIRWPEDNMCLDANETGATYASNCWKEDIGQRWIRKVVG
ncbi:hypothetical protein [Streptomyces cavernae]|uniref:hypothetical protein n=1 Tax=Streptomyces cavernae TaxID=2259034 RepID=UPI000FEBF20C|nr:hypothetical protein [Streptomyces cavernae]